MGIRHIRNERKIQELREKSEQNQQDYETRLKTLSDKEEKLRLKLRELDNESIKLYSEKTKDYYKIQEEIQKLCDHPRYPVRRRENLRDDRSFVYWLHCSNCDKDVGHSN